MWHPENARKLKNVIETAIQSTLFSNLGVLCVSGYRDLLLKVSYIFFEWCFSFDKSSFSTHLSAALILWTKNHANLSFMCAPFGT